MVSHYRIVEKLGGGGMGVVYKAQDISLGRFVALKFLPEAMSRVPDALARFHREARAASSLNHPGICTIYEIGEEEGRPYIVMELLEGESLEQHLRHASPDIAMLLDLGIQIADALETAHAQGIVHRDIKPGNIFITTRGQAKLLDFGLAKISPHAALTVTHTLTQTADASDATLTRAGSIMGTLTYMSPEQVRGQALDTRSDLFSFGIVLYQLATGILPFRGETTGTMLDAVLHKNPVSIERLNPDLPSRLEEIINKCLEKDRNLRYQHASDISSDLKRVKRDWESRQNSFVSENGDEIASPGMTIAPASAVRLSGVQSPSVSAGHTPARKAISHRRMWLWVCIVAAALVIVGSRYLSGHWTLKRWPGWLLAGRTRAAETAVLPVTIRPLANLPGRKQLPIFSYDGNAVVFAWDEGHQEQNCHLYMMQVDGGPPIRLTHHSASEWPISFSPDGRRLYFVRQSERGSASYWIPALGGQETWVADGYMTDISPDGHSALVVRLGGGENFRNGVFVTDLASGNQRRLGDDFGTMNPVFGPDGHWIYLLYGSNRDGQSVYRVPVEGGTPELARFPELEAGVDRVEAIEFDPRHRHLWITARARYSNTLISFIANADGSEPKRLPGTVTSVTSGALSPDGRQMVMVRNKFLVPLYRVEAFSTSARRSEPQKCLDVLGEVYSPRISPDGNRIAVSAYRGGFWGIWVWNISMTDGHPVFNSEGDTVGSPVWSPDGKWLAFDARSANTAGEIWLASASGGEPKIVVDRPAGNFTPCFDPTSQWIYFTSNRTGTLQLFRAPATGGSATQVTKGGGFRCQFSEDGRYVYYLKTRSGGEIWRLELASGQEELVAPTMKSSNWKVMRDGIYLLRSGADSQRGTAPRIAEAFFYRFATKRIEDLHFRTAKPIPSIGIEVSPDGKWLYYSQVDSWENDLYLVENLP